MLGVSWQDFEVNSALQRDTLERAMPLVQTSTTDDWTDLINMADPDDPGYLTLVPDPIVGGATPESCVELLALRPLLFGTAWTVLDFLLEEPSLRQTKRPTWQTATGRSTGRGGTPAPALPSRPA